MHFRLGLKRPTPNVQDSLAPKDEGSAIKGDQPGPRQKRDSLMGGLKRTFSGLGPRLMAGTSGSLRATARDRAPPPPPLPIDFPHFLPANQPYAPFTDDAKANINSIFGSIRKPTDISPRHFEVLNLTVHVDVPLELLIPTGHRSFLPPLEWDHPSVSSSGNVTTHPSTSRLCNGNEAPGEDVYRQRKSELTLDNDDAFRAVLRDPPRRGRQAVRLGFFYKFWQGLESMSQYWDSTMDEYSSDVAGTYRSTDPDEMDVDVPVTKRGSYSGRRVGIASDMPETYREETVKRLVETVAWLFGCQIAGPRLPPRVKLQTTLFPVRLTQSVCRVASDRQLARQGFMDGPILEIQCRPEISFRLDSESVGTGHGEMLDLLREVGVLLLMAQERAREGKEEKRPGEGQWYTTTPRWGGGPGGEVGNASGNSDEIEPRPREDRKRDSRPRSRKANAAEAYKRLAPGMGIWDPKMTYMRIGKHPQSQFDDVFLVSSINHHVAILRLRISDAYLDFLDNGTIPPPITTSSSSPGSPWHILDMYRTKWYDLFDADSRLQVMRGIWGVMAYQMRPTTTQSDPDLPGLVPHSG